jgi:hypothetical protein
VKRFVLGLALLLVVVAYGEDSVVDPGRFCELDFEIGDLEDPFDVPAVEAGDIVRRGRGLLDEALEVVPDEIRAAAEAAADAFRSYLDLAEAAEFDPARIEEEAFRALVTDEVTAAFEVLEQWRDANCSEPSIRI